VVRLCGARVMSFGFERSNRDGNGSVSAIFYDIRRAENGTNKIRLNPLRIRGNASFGFSAESFQTRICFNHNVQRVEKFKYEF
jgi:hypothetical protein